MKGIALLLFCMVLIGVSGAAAQGRFSGYMFGDYFYNAARDTAFKSGDLSKSAVGGQKDLKGFQFRRIYFTYDNDISEHFIARFRLEANNGETLGDGKMTAIVKDAYLNWKNIFPGSNAIFGIQPTPAYDISEVAWGYRSLEKTIMDLRGIVPSRGLGLSLKGKFDEGGIFNYWVMASNINDGTKPNGTTSYGDKYSRYYLLLHVKPVKNLQVTLYGDYLGAPPIDDPTSTTSPKATVANGTLTGAAFVGYAEPDKFNLGVEGFVQTKSNGQSNPTPGATLPLARTSLSAVGVSVFGSLNVASDLAVVARFDMFDPNSNVNVKGDARNYIIGGLSWKPDKNVSIIPNVQVETYQSLPATPTFAGRSIAASVTGRLTFYYVYL
jgi:hypothetical protein